jgi:hypothetical protein
LGFYLAKTAYLDFFELSSMIRATSPALIGTDSEQQLLNKEL